MRPANRNFLPKPAPAVKITPKAANPTSTSFMEEMEEAVHITPQTKQYKKKPSRVFFKVFIATLVILVLAVVGLAIFLPKTTITIYARSEPISRDFEITVNKNVSTADPNLLQIPGIAVAKEVSQTKTFTATGTKLTGTQAVGSVIIYNFTANTIKLNAATTTLIANGKKYTFNKDVSGIKPTSGTTVQPQASSLTPAVSVVAFAAGETYNLPANTKFQVVNSALGNQNVYAINPVDITGGQATATTVLSQEDYDKAAAELLSDATAAASADLSQENSATVKIVDSGVTKEVLAKTANKEIGEATDTFAMTLIAKVTGVAFKESDVQSVVESKIKSVLSSDKYLVDDGKTQSVEKFKSVDPVTVQGVLDVHYETTAAYDVDSSNLTKILAGKNEMDIKQILLSKPEVDDVKVEFWPAWLVHKTPQFNGKIYIKTELSK
jgi:hypothetical protein